MNEFYYNGLNISWKVTIEDSNFDWVAGDFGDFGDLGELIWAGDGSPSNSNSLMWMNYVGFVDFKVLLNSSSFSAEVFYLSV